MKHLTGFGALAIAALLFALAYITGVKGILIDCIAHTCTTLQLPQPLSLVVGALLAAGGSPLSTWLSNRFGGIKYLRRNRRIARNDHAGA